MSMKSLFLFGLFAAGGVSADLRQASQPRNGFVVRQRGAVQFQAKTALYMEPSDFQYGGLKQQRDNGAYDNFLRSNIDNEQDRRNFNVEPGRDMLPFRSFEAAMTDVSGTVKNKLPADNPAYVATPGTPFVVPLRWNNPHASELEVNVWISNNQYVVPIRKPTCSGEGHQDNVFTFTIPQDFNQLGAKVPGFAGCKKVGDCVLQIYAHSVEPRTYAIGTPLIVTGDVPPATATTTAAIEPAQVDVGLDLTKLTRDLCLSSADPAANIASAVPRAARLISDVYNHAYQNSDYSPYSGQQPEAISRNLQAAAIVGMIPSNQGEIGKALFKQTNPQGAAAQKALENKVKNLVKQYEGIVNNIIQKIGDKTMANSDTMGVGDAQKTATAFRAAEVGATTPTRLRTNTYVPSFQLPAAQVAAAKALVPAKYQQLIDADGTVQIYTTVLNDLKGEFVKASALGLNYLGPMIKKTATTMADPTAFRKLDAAGKRDGGIYAAGLAAAAKKAAGIVAPKITASSVVSPLFAALAADDGELPDIETDPIRPMSDMDALMSDSNCDNDAIPDGDDGLPVVFCQPPRPMFAPSGAAEGDGLIADQAAAQDASSSSSLNLPLIIGIAAGASALVLVAIVGVVVYRRKQQTTTVQHTSHATRDNMV